MKSGSNQSLLEAYPYLAEDSLYRADTSDFTKRTITPVMASLAELLRSTPKYEIHYDWFVDLARNFHSVSHSINIEILPTYHSDLNEFETAFAKFQLCMDFF